MKKSSLVMPLLIAIQERQNSWSRFLQLVKRIGKFLFGDQISIKFILIGAYDSPYWVIGTEYQSYTVIWSCTEVGSSNLRNFAINNLFAMQNYSCCIISKKLWCHNDNLAFAKVFV
jgi:hypothetical protein